MATLGVDNAVLVQASDSLAETDELLRVSRAAKISTRVVGWLPLEDADRTARELDDRPDVTLVGVRHLIHDEPDPQWMLRPDVAAGMSVVERRGLSFDAVAARPDLLAQVPQIARRHPEMTIVLDHLGNPPIAAGWASEESQRWAGQLAAIARELGTVAKISGLATLSSAGWTSRDWQPFVDHALERFGADRLMIGSDWPVSNLNGDYASVVHALLEVVDRLSPTEQASVKRDTALRVYSRRAQPQAR
jgi:L-fuconolactonase